LAEDSQQYAAIQQTPFTVGAERDVMKVFTKVIAIIGYTVVILLGLGALALLILGSIFLNFPYTLAYDLHHQGMSVIIAVGFLGLFFGFWGIPLLYLSVRIWRDQFKLRRDGVRVEGRITRHHDNYSIRYSYDYQGQTYSRGERVSEKYSGTFSEGTPVPVLCVAHDPTVARVADPTTGSIVNNQGSGIVIMLGLGVMFFGLTMWVVWLLLTALTTRVL